MLTPYYKKGVVEAGCDEAGRGCLAGPVVAAAVILPAGFRNRELNDSKKLSSAMRSGLRDLIMDKALDYGIGIADNDEIDRHNILRATFFAMHRAIQNLRIRPEFLLIDGNRFMPFEDIPYSCIVKGDGTFMSVAAASILAKTFRDDMMRDYAKEFPRYGWDNNAGYPTRMHRMAIRKFGITPYHRRTFRLLDNQVELF